MQNLKDLIFTLLDNDSKTLVFTSEVVARSWLRKYTMESGHRTVFSERAISWDKFKSTFINPGNLKAVSNVERQIFANRFLKENFDKLTFFSSRYQESIAPFASAVAGYLPLFAYADSKSGEALHDINLIVDAYGKYLKENNLYEYNFLPRDYSSVNGNNVLIFPEIFNDPIVDEIKGKCMVVSTREITDRNLKIVSYRNSLTEIRSVLRDIAERLDRGEDPNSISITCGCIDEYRPYLRAEADKLDVDICFTTSLPVMSSPQGRFFEILNDIVEKDYSFDSVKALLLDPGFPFKQPDMNMKLLKAAIRLQLKNSPREEWVRRLKTAVEPEFEGCADYFEKLSGCITGFFESLDTENFTDEFFREDAFFFKQNGVFEKCRSVLKQVGEYGLFLQILKNETYVDSARNGIRVYRYPVSAGIASDVNYVIGLDDRNTAVSFDKYPYLPMFRKDAEEAESTIKTDEVLAVYTNGDFDGKVILSGTKNGFEGTRLLPITLVEKKPEKTEEDIYGNEIDIWCGIKKSDRFSKAQKKGYEAAKQSVLKFSDKTEFPEESDFAGRKISASAFKDFVKCPYMGFISFFIKPKQMDYEPNYLDPRRLGEILHNTIQASLSEVRTLSNLSEEVLSKHLHEEVSKAARDYKIGPKVFQDYIEQKYSGILPELASAGAIDVMSGATLFGNEKTFTKNHVIEGLDNVQLIGRPDTILQNFEGFIILDYKTTDSGKDHSETLKECNPQVAVYARILKDNIENAEVVAGGYYTIASGKTGLVWPQETKKGNVSYEDVELYFNENENRLRQAILNSSFEKSNDGELCCSCRYNGICRRRFVVK